MKTQSLRTRLILIILSPLLLISLLAGAWQFKATADRAEDIFDRGLLSAALAISRDVAISDGDALSPATRRLVNDTSGGELFYHVYAPDGVFVTGYSTPPVLPRTAPEILTEPLFYDARYQERDVRVVRFQDVTTVSEVSGVYNITVWQNADVRGRFIREVVSRSFAVIALLVISVALVVWFGVGLGLKPLLDLESAIAKRTPTELKPIRRAVPVEARGLVSTLNALLDRVSRRISSKDEFISNAAHQLRNPVAGVLALAEAVQTAPNAAAAKERSAELVDAAREASQLTNQLLSFERASGTDVLKSGQPLNLKSIVQQVSERFALQNADSSVILHYDLPQRDVPVRGDEIMLQEAILNLLNNALVHGGAGLSEIRITLSMDRTSALLCVEDDGVGIPPDQFIQAISRFSQTNGGPGSGLGLPIAARVMENHGGTLEIMESAGGAFIKATLPLYRSSGAD
ncbi:sensor histidine kinase [Tateyamaria pelophila]|uniref:sensor histidine kinase n=1 Tax=Tateyamaria pelophila TaxID=328415 RepID=UPI001CC0321B|nr:sensor histidine kinase [Tateyamaria pelophila]